MAFSNHFASMSDTSPQSQEIIMQLSPHFDLRSRDGYDLGELDQALFLYLDESPSQDRQMRPPTLDIFPSEPIRVLDPSSTTKEMETQLTNGLKRSSEPCIELTDHNKYHNGAPVSSGALHRFSKSLKREGNGRKCPTSSSEHDAPKTPDPKTLRRLAQNREAARKSRLRKKAYVQQLESSRIRLTQLEQELQRARAQGVLYGGGEPGVPLGCSSNFSTEAVVFDMEYARWLDEHHRLMYELRLALQEQIPENELRLFVDHCLTHFDEMISLKSMVVKSDVFHLVSGIWKSPAERCFMWMGGFRPSDLLKIILRQTVALTEQQVVGMCGLQQSTAEAEEALSQGLHALNQSLSDTIACDALISPPDNVSNYMRQMALAMNKMSNLEGFVTQADNLRQQTIHRLQQLLTTRQAARCFLVMAEYFHRLRALSSLWFSRPKTPADS